MFMYCTYITFYSGNQLPPFYIGSSSVNRIVNGYHGSVSSKMYIKAWLSELKNNPHLFKTKIISLHTTRAEATDKESKLQKALKVRDNPLYINRAYWHNGKLIYGAPHTAESKRKLSDSHKGKVFSVEHRLKLSIARKNRKQPPWNKGKHGLFKHTEEHKQYVSTVHKGKVLSESTKLKIGNASRNRGAQDWLITNQITGEVFKITNLLQWCKDTFCNPISAASGLRKRNKYKHYSGILLMH